MIAVTRVPRTEIRTYSGTVLPRLFQEVRGGPAFPSEQAVDRVRAQIALTALITEQCFAVAPAQEECGAQSGWSAADNKNIKFHQKPFRCLSIEGRSQSLATG